MSLKQTILTLIKENTPVQVVVGKVISINEKAMTCDVKIPSQSDRFDVRLRATIDGTDAGILIYPKKDSHVLIGLIENNKQSSFICGYTEVEKVRLINCEIELNGNTHGGLVKTPVLRTELNKTIARITALESAILAFATTQTSAASAIPVFAPLIPGWTALGAAMGALPPQGTYSNNIENSKVKHG